MREETRKLHRLPLNGCNDAFDTLIGTEQENYMYRVLFWNAWLHGFSRMGRVNFLIFILNDVIISMTAHLLYVKVVDAFTIFTDINSLPLKIYYNKERSGCSFRRIALII